MMDKNIKFMKSWVPNDYKKEQTICLKNDQLVKIKFGYVKNSDVMREQWMENAKELGEISATYG